MSSNKRKSVLKTLVTSYIGCGCGSTWLSDVYEPTPMHPSTSSVSHNQPTINTSECFTSTTAVSKQAEAEKENMNMSENAPLIADCIAVEKDSNNPYKDFRHSMIHMICEKEIYSKKDLEELLECFLELNPACHHHVIVLVFMEICQQIFAKKKQLL